MSYSKSYFWIFYFHLLIVSVLSSQEHSEQINSTHKLVVIVIDGLRWDDVITPVNISTAEDAAEWQSSYFTDIQREGVTAKWNSPVFPTTPLPNVYTMFTGELPATHGKFTDDFSAKFTPELPTLWTRALKNNMKTALFRIDDCSTPSPLPLEEENEEFVCLPMESLSEDVENTLVQFIGDIALASELLMEKHYHLVILRTRILQEVAQIYGLKSSQLRTFKSIVQENIQSLVDSLKQRNLWQDLNAVLLSPNGLTNIEEFKTVSPIYDCITEGDIAKEFYYRHLSAGSAIISPIRNYSGTDIVSLISDCGYSQDAMFIISKSDVTSSDQWEGNEEEVLIIARENYAIVDKLRDVPEEASNSLWSKLEEEELLRSLMHHNKAGDGYDSHFSHMRAVFIVTGPDVNQGIVSAISQTETYSVLCQLIGLNLSESQPLLYDEIFSKSVASSFPNCCTIVMLAVTLLNIIQTIIH